MSPVKLVILSPNINSPILGTEYCPDPVSFNPPEAWAATLAAKPVAPTVTSSPAVNRVPCVMNPIISLPTTDVTVNLAWELVPSSVIPIDGNIPLILTNCILLVETCCIVTFTYLTLAGGCGGSAKTIESPCNSNAVPGVCTTPFNTIINWLALATTLLPSTVRGNDIFSPSNWFDISSNLCTTEVRMFSEEVRRFWRNRTSVLLNSE